MIGAELRNIRERMGLSQAALAERVGVDANTVARWERDERAIQEPVARLIDALFRKTRGEAAPGDDQERRESDLERLLASPPRAEALASFRGLEIVVLKEIEELLNMDRGNERGAKQILVAANPDLPAALETALVLFTTILRASSGSIDDEQNEAKRIVKELGAITPEINRALRSGKIPRRHPKSTLIKRLSEVQDRVSAKIVTALLIEATARAAYWAVTDLFRLRVTPVLGYLRYQAEAVGMIHLVAKDPSIAREWLTATLPPEGKRFQGKYQAALNQEMKRIGLGSAYEFGSSMSVHATFGSLTRGLGHQTTLEGDQRVFGVSLLFQEVDERDPRPYLDVVLAMLQAQRSIFNSLAKCLPSLTDPITVETRIPSFAETVMKLTQTHARRFGPELLRRARERRERRNRDGS